MGCWFFFYFLLSALSIVTNQHTNGHKCINGQYAPIYWADFIVRIEKRRVREYQHADTQYCWGKTRVRTTARMAKNQKNRTRVHFAIYIIYVKRNTNNLQNALTTHSNCCSTNKYTDTFNTFNVEILPFFRPTISLSLSSKCLSLLYKNIRRNKTKMCELS